MKLSLGTTSTQGMGNTAWVSIVSALKSSVVEKFHKRHPIDFIYFHRLTLGLLN